MDFSTHKPVKIICGNNAIEENCELFSKCGKRAIIVSGKHSADKSGAFEAVRLALLKAGCTYVRFARIPENPPASLCHEAGETARRELCDFVIGIGGGSALDSAKAVAAYAANPMCGVMDIYDDTLRINESLPVIEIPTTAGTGSEACRYSVLTIDGGERKKTYKSPSSYAKYSFVCPKFTKTLSENYTISTALDALAHALESYLSPKSTEKSEEAALYAAREVWDVIFRGADSEGDRDVGGFTAKQRERLMYAACAAGIAIDYTGTGFPHPLGYSITLTRGVPHGRACAIFEGEFINYNMKTPEGEHRIKKIADYIGVEPSKMAEMIPEKSGVNLSIDKQEREKLIDRVAGAGNYKNSPYVISREEMSEIYASAFGEK